MSGLPLLPILSGQGDPLLARGRYQPLYQSPAVFVPRARPVVGKWRGMPLVYAFFAMYSFVFAIIFPTSDQYAQRLLRSERYGGFLVAAFSFGQVLGQPVQQVLLRHLGVRGCYGLFSAVFATGSALYAAAEQLRSPTTLFVGRAVCGLCAGPQLFFEVAHRTMGDAAERRDGVVRLTLSYLVGYIGALFAATLLLEAVTDSPTVALNALTAPAAIGGGVALLVGLAGVGCLSTVPAAPPEERVLLELGPPALPGPRPLHQASAALAIAGLTFYSEGLRQVALFEIAPTQWQWSLPQTSLFAALMFVAHVPTVPCDHLVPPRLLPAVLLAEVPCLLLFAPWGLPYPLAPCLYAAANVAYGPLKRVAFAVSSSVVLAHARQSAHPSRWVVALSAASALGIGIGAAVSTFSPTAAFVVGAALAAVGALVAGSVLSD